MAGLKDIAEEAGVDDGLAARFVEALATAISRGDRVIIRGLGTFHRQYSRARKFNTAIMRQAVQKPARYRVVFKTSDLLLDRLPVPLQNITTGSKIEPRLGETNGNGDAE